VSAIINLAWRYLTWGHGGTVIVGDEPTADAPPEPAAFRPGAQRGSPSQSITGRDGPAERSNQAARAQAGPSS
jgi:hypothetical protein